MYLRYKVRYGGMEYVVYDTTNPLYFRISYIILRLSASIENRYRSLATDYSISLVFSDLRNKLFTKHFSQGLAGFPLLRVCVGKIIKGFASFQCGYIRVTPL